MAQNISGIGLPKKVPIPIDQSCVGYWKFDEASGTIRDYSKNVNTGTMSGTPTYSQAGKFGNAIFFDGIYAHMSFSNIKVIDSTLGAQAFSAEMWVKTLSVTGKGCCSTGTIGRGSPLQMMRFDQDMRIYLGWYIEGATPAIDDWIYVATIITNDVWHHIIATLSTVVNGTNYDYTSKHYIDGKMIGTASWINAGKRDIIFNDFGGMYNYYHGTIDELRLYSRELSANEVYKHYLRGR